MTGYLLDTNVLSEFSRRGEPDRNVERWLQTLKPIQLNVSVLTLAELRRGIERSPFGKRKDQLESWFEKELLPTFLPQNILPVDQGIADRWARLSALAQSAGTPLAVIDGLLAATAIENGLIVATRNTRDFLVTGVQLSNPWDSVQRKSED